MKGGVGGKTGRDEWEGGREGESIWWRRGKERERETLYPNTLGMAFTDC